MMLTKVICMLLIGIIMSIHAFSQSDNYKDASHLGLDNIANAQKTPEVSSLKDLGTSDVELYTGRATYTIPLFTMQTNKLKLPITLNYCSSGVKVEKLSGWVGLDWNLTAGGEIVRELNGKPDETADIGYFAKGKDVNKFYSDVQTETLGDDQISEADKKNMIEKAEENEIDCRPDVFHFSFPGYSGKFIIDQNNNIQCIPYLFLKIAKSLGTDNRLNGFEVLTPDGTKYTFGMNSDAIEETKMSTITYWANNPTEDDVFTLAIDNQKTFETKEIPYYTSKWYLSKIESAFGDYINFSYTGFDNYYVDPQRVVSNGWVGNIGNFPQFQNGYQKLMERYYNMYFEPKTAYGSVPEEHKFYPYYYVPDAVPYLTTGVLNQPPSSSTDPKMPLLYHEYISGNQTTDAVKNRRSDNAIRYTISQSRYEIQQKVLSSITTSNGFRATFNSDVPEYDSPNGLMLSSILFFDKNNILFKSFDFSYDDIVSKFYDSDLIDPFSLGEALCFKNVNFSEAEEVITPKYGENYFDNSLYSASLGNYVKEGLKEYNYHRAFLRFVREYNGTILKPPYEFSYISPENLQRRTSNWVDYWGYNNEEAPIKKFTNDANQNLSVTLGLPGNNFPTFNYIESPGLYNIYPSDAVREKPTLVSQNGLLSEIKTPLGGILDYNYEDNDSKAGCRVSSIISKTSENETSLTRTYKYKGAWVPPVCYTSYLDYIEEVGWEQYTGYRDNFSIYKIFINTSFNQFEIPNFNGSNIGYGEVEVSSGNGKEVYAFSNPVIETGEVYSYPKIELGNWKFKQYGNNSDGTNLYYFYQQEDNVFYKENNGRLPDPNNNLISYSAPFIINDDSYRRGILQSVSVYNNYYPVKVTNYSYTEVPQSSEISLKTMSYNNIVRADLTDDITSIQNIKAFKKYKAGFYTFKSVWNRLDAISEKIDGVNKSQNFTYSNGLVSSVTSQQSDGSKLITNYKYPLDYIFPGSCARLNSRWLAALMEKNRLSEVIEKYTVIKKDQSEKVVDGELTLYNIDISKLMPSCSYKLKTTIPLTDFVSSYVDFNSCIFKFDNRYNIQKVFDNYDNNGNILQSHTPNDIYNSYQWGYDKTLLTAKAENASYNQFFYDGFEDTGVWDSNIVLSVNNSAPTILGSKHGEIFNNTGGVISSLPYNWINVSLTKSVKYKYSGWIYSYGPIGYISLIMKRSGETAPYTYRDYLYTKTTKQWVFLEKEFEVPSDVTQLGIRLDNEGMGVVSFDDIRLWPSDVRLTTYAYKPLIGMTSQTDPNNQTTWYNYDDLGRLKDIRDNDKNILKKYTYHYHDNNDIVRYNPSMNLTPTGAGLVSFSAYDGMGTSSKYLWDFGDGTTSSSQNGTHKYSSSGTYNASVTISHPDYGIFKLNKSVTLNASPMNVIFSTYVQGGTVQFDGSDGVSSLAYPSMFSWDFGDGSFGYGNSVTHSYAASGTYTVTLHSSNSFYGNASISKNITIKINSVKLLVDIEGNLNPSCNYWGSTFAYLTAEGLDLTKCNVYVDEYYCENSSENDCILKGPTRYNLTQAEGPTNVYEYCVPVLGYSNTYTKVQFTFVVSDGKNTYSSDMYTGECFKCY